MEFTGLLEPQKEQPGEGKHALLSVLAEWVLTATLLRAIHGKPSDRRETCGKVIRMPPPGGI